MGTFSEDVIYYRDALSSTLEALGQNETVLQILGFFKYWGTVVFGDPSAKQLSLAILLVAFAAILHRLVHSYRAWNSQVKYSWDEDRLPRLGETATLKIFFFPPPSPETVGDEFLSHLTAQIAHEDGHEVVSEMSANPFEKTVLVKFKLEKAGKYTISIKFQGYSVGDTPFTISIDSDRMDPSKTVMSVQSPIVSTQGRVYRVDIIPIDEYGNRCSATNDDLMRLSVEMEKLGEGEDTKIEEDEMISSFGLRRDTSFTEDTIITILTLNLKPRQAGVYLMSLFHNDEPFPTSPSKYEIVVLTEDEDLMVMLNEMENKQALSPIAFPAVWTIYEDARLNGEEEANVPCVIGTVSDDWIHRRIQVELSPRFVYFRGQEYPDSPDTTVIMTFRVSPQTKVEMVDQWTRPQGNVEYALNIYDTLSSYSAQIWMSESSARIFYALFTKFMRSFQDGSQPTFDSKKDAFFRKLREQKLPLSNSGKRANSKNYRFLKIRRNDEIESTLEETKNFNASDWRRPFVILYHGEASGASKNNWIRWADSVLDKLLENSTFGMFNSLGSSKLIHPNPQRNIRWTLDHYELAGKIIGKYLFESAQDDKLQKTECFVNARFTRSFLAQLLSFMPNFKHVELDNPNMYHGTIEPILKEDVTFKNLYFMGPFYDDLGNVSGLRSLIPDGNQVPVTNENKAMYLNELAKLILQSEVKEEVKAFVAGLSLLIPQELLMSFSENELELLICGCSKWNIQDFQKYATFADDTMIPHAPRMKEWLWESLREMDFQDRGLFLQFLTGSSRLPPEGLSQLNPRIKINVSCLYGHIPTANPVTHVLNLSDHANRQEFALALITAVRAQLT